MSTAWDGRKKIWASPKSLFRLFQLFNKIAYKVSQSQKYQLGPHNKFRGIPGDLLSELLIDHILYEEYLCNIWARHEMAGTPKSLIRLFQLFNKIAYKVSQSQKYQLGPHNKSRGIPGDLLSELLIDHILYEEYLCNIWARHEMAGTPKSLFRLFQLFNKIAYKVSQSQKYQLGPHNKSRGIPGDLLSELLIDHILYEEYLCNIWARHEMAGTPKSLIRLFQLFNKIAYKVSQSQKYQLGPHNKFRGIPGDLLS